MLLFFMIVTTFYMIVTKPTGSFAECLRQKLIDFQQALYH